jgi:hypothetical protein
LIDLEVERFWSFNNRFDCIKKNQRE